MSKQFPVEERTRTAYKVTVSVGLHCYGLRGLVAAWQSNSTLQDLDKLKPGSCGSFVSHQPLGSARSFVWILDLEEVLNTFSKNLPSLVYHIYHQQSILKLGIWDCKMLKYMIIQIIQILHRFWINLLENMRYVLL